MNVETSALAMSMKAIVPAAQLDTPQLVSSTKVACAGATAAPADKAAAMVARRRPRNFNLRMKPSCFWRTQTRDRSADTWRPRSCRYGYASCVPTDLTPCRKAISMVNDQRKNRRLSRIPTACRRSLKTNSSHPFKFGKVTLRDAFPT